MAIVALTSAAGSPGTTTTALGWALGAADRVLLVEADPAGSSIVPGYFRCSLGYTRSILGVALSLGTEPTTSIVMQQAVDLEQLGGEVPNRSSVDEAATDGVVAGAKEGEGSVPGPWAGLAEASGTARAAAGDGAARSTAAPSGGGVEDWVEDSRRRLLLPGLPDPGQAGAMQPIWSDLAEALSTASAAGYTVICDLGRITQASYPMPLLQASDLVVFSIRNSLSSVVRSRPALEALKEQMTRTGRGDALAVGMLPAAGGRGYTDVDLHKSLGVPILTIAWEPDAAAVLSDGTPEPRRRRGGSSRLMSSYRTMASQAGQLIIKRRERIDGRRARQQQ